MPLNFNYIDVQSINFNNTPLDQITFNGVTVWENWKAWNDNKSNKWTGHPSSPQTLSIITGNKIRVQNISLYGEKAYVEGEYGRISIWAYYDSSWHKLKESEAGSSGMSISWGGDLICDSIQARIDMNICSWVSLNLKVSGLKKGS